MRPKRLLILSCTGGYGHIAAANTLTSLLKDSYEIETAYPIEDLRICGFPSAVNFYNFLISNSLNRTTNWIVRNLTTPVFQQRANKLIRLMDQYLAKTQPDLIISVVPYVNYAASEAARKMGIPMLLVTTDNDLTKWVGALDKRRLTEFRATIGSDHTNARRTLVAKGVPDESVETIGLPLRPNFLQKHDLSALRNKYNVPEGKKVVLVVLGGVGVKATFNYARAIATSSLDVHLLVCTGRNQRLARKLKSIRPSIGHSLEIIPFTENMAEVFSVADLIVTKPGPGSINEAMTCQLPILIDQRVPPLFWEQANIDLVEKYKVGDCVYSIEELVPQIQRYLFEEQIQEQVRAAYKQVAPNQFAEKIVPIVDEIVGDLVGGEVAVSSRSYTPSSL